MEEYLLFLNSLKISIKFTDIQESYPHEEFSLSGWKGLKSLNVLSENNEIYEIDIRYAWGEEIFRQNLIDSINSQDGLLHLSKKNDVSHHKLIIYLCESSTNLNCESKLKPVPHDYLIAQSWQSFFHLYLQLPKFHPFSLPSHLNSNKSSSKSQYSTTRYLQQYKTSHDKQLEVNPLLNSSCKSEFVHKKQGGLRTKGKLKIVVEYIPLITIITVVFNGESDLEQTIQSVINQTYPNIEYLIIDGNSTDKTLDVISQYEDQINYWLSESDYGVYDAMNKGWDFANNDSYILFLGAGDMIISLPKIEGSKNIIFGKAIRGETGLYNASSGWRLKLGNSIHHQALIIPKSICLTPPFNITYKIYADYDFNARLSKKGAKFMLKQDFLAYALPAGLSDKVYLKELLKIILANYGIFWMFLALIYYFCQGIRYGFERISISR